MILYPDSFRFFNPIKVLSIFSQSHLSCWNPPIFFIMDEAMNRWTNCSFALQLHYHGQRVQKHHHSDDRVECLLGATQDPRGPKDPPKKNRTQLLDTPQLYLVGGWAIPRWKIWVRQLGLLFPIYGTRRRMARERRGAESSVVSMETLYYKIIY